jgi:two-component system sensor histidine kinase BaeS
MFRKIRRHLGIKFFISYFVVILMGIIVLVSATQFTVPNAFNRHMAEMTAAMGPEASELEADLYRNFQNAVTESLVFSAAAAFIFAIVVSLFVTRQVVAPIRRIRKASQYIAEGHYSERVQIPGSTEKNEMDELAQLSMSFNQMTLRLEQAETLRKQLIGDLAHELRTPLSTIKGSLEGLIDGVLPANKDSFHQIYQEAERLQLLVNDLQDLNRVESGAYQLNLAPVDLKNLLELTGSRLERQFQDKGVALGFDFPEALPEVRGDRDRLGQVFMNIIGNSLQYTPAGGKVDILGQIRGGEVEIVIQDTGIGIAEEHLPHIFTRFYRVDKSSSRAGGGSGIGLTIAKSLVESHGGRIRADSPGLGMGSIFTVQLPIP